MGIDAVWIPPIYKNPSTNSVGYSPFDHYDLGDKFQKGNVKTRIGSKDEVLRMIAVLHANGIEVIQDIVLNHVDGAGSLSGAGGQDPEANYSMLSNNGFKNFRYVCYETPAPLFGQATAAQYWSRKGRWIKNYQNFHPNTNHNIQNTDWTEPFWGPDLSYGYQEDGTGNGFGESSNANCATCYNPTQSYNHNRDEARAWLKWLVKQTDVDGFRWDAVKHFPPYVVQDLSYNVKYLNGWANRNETMVNFGEYVGGGATLDAWVNDVATANGGNDKLAGTMDFGLRGAFQGIVAGGGNYDLSQVTGNQQNERVTYYGTPNTYVHTTIPFVNNHDTYRPQLNANGNITGWNTSDELAPHIDPTDPRLSVVYALNLALDGNPLIFFEDLFNIQNTGKRFSHQPTNTTDLPQRNDLENIIWCHQNLNFKDGVYKVRGHSGNTGDHLLIERSGKAIIGANDNWTDWQTDWIDSDFPAGTVLKDYGNSATNTTIVQNDQRVQIATPPCNGSATRRGYSIWAPVGQAANTYEPPRNPKTTQEWEMANDLGDSHCNSLGQGGRLPDNSTDFRVVGKVFADANKKMDIEIYGENNVNSITLLIYDLDGNLLFEKSNVSPLTTDFTPTVTDWYVLKVKNTNDTYNGQKCWVKVAYTAPEVVNTTQYPSRLRLAIWKGSWNTDWSDCRNWEEGLMPSSNRDALILGLVPNMPTISNNRFCRNLTLQNGATVTIDGDNTTFTIIGDVTSEGGNFAFANGCSKVVLKRNPNASNFQTITGNLDFCHLALDNVNNLVLNGNVTIDNELTLINGKIALNSFSLMLGENSIINGANENRYIITENIAQSSGYFIRTVTASETLFPIGNENSYTPIFLNNDAAVSQAKVRVFDDIYQVGNQGLLITGLDSSVRKTWEIIDESGSLEPKVKLQWHEDNEGANFEKNSATIMAFYNNKWHKIATTSISSGNDFEQITTSSFIQNYSFFAVADSQMALIQTPIITPPNGSDTITYKIYPNPTSHTITIEASGNYDAQQDNFEVTVYTIDGKLVDQISGIISKVNNDLQAKFAELYRGVYVLDILYNNQKTQLKIIKE